MDCCCCWLWCCPRSREPLELELELIRSGPSEPDTSAEARATRDAELSRYAEAIVAANTGGAARSADLYRDRLPK